MRKKSSTPNRSFKVADQIQRDLTELIARELKDPRLGVDDFFFAMSSYSVRAISRTSKNSS